MLIRLQKIISDAGITSRRAAEELITAGKVRVNKVVVTKLGAKADLEKDVITVNGRTIKPTQKKIYIMMHKPVGYVTTMKDPQGRAVVTDLLKGVRERVYPVGRLDYDSSGLLLFTNDGETANKLAHPRHKVSKRYKVKIKGKLTGVELRKLRSGDPKLGFFAPVEVYVDTALPKNTWLVITIAQGKNRQVRRMCESVGHDVLKLIRESYGELTLGALKPGEFRHLTQHEMRYLKGV